MLPDNIATSAFPRVRETCRRIGVKFDPWQQDLNRCILGKAPDGLWAADTVALSIPRQVGKTFDVGAVAFARCINEPGLTVIWTAHRFKVARESFNEQRALAKSSKLVPHIDFDAITTAAGNECIPFRNGSRIVFAARERGAIRGFTKVGLLVLDEAQILTDQALADLAPTMNQATNPQIILMGTPPKPTDPGEVFTSIRSDALDGSSEGVLYVEFSAEEGADPDDRAQWRVANPSYPSRTPARSILRLRKLLSREDFLREALGIWDALAGRRLFTVKAWSELTDPSSALTGRPTVALEVAQDFSWACITAAGRRSDGLMHVQVLENWPGTGWVVEKAAELGQPVWLAPNSPAGSLIEPLRKARVRVHEVLHGDYAKACGMFFDLYNNAGLRHLGQPELNTAVLAARKRVSADAWVFDRRDETDISPLASAAIAVYATPKHKPGKGRVMALD